MAIINGGDTVMHLNVGGSLYTTLLSTLTRYSDSTLGATLKASKVQLPRDQSGNYVIDGDGPMFRHVLNFYRRSKLNLPDDFSEWDLLVSEAEFYGPKELVGEVRKARIAASKRETEMEYIEITEWVESSLVYKGSRASLEKIQLLLDFCQAQSETVRTADEVLMSVENDGSTSVPLRPAVFYSDPPGGFEGIRMRVFRQISQLGFELCSGMSPCASSNCGNLQLRWLFARRVSRTAGDE